MPRFFIDSGVLSGDVAYLTGENAAHARVLRLREGEALVLCDGEGTDYACTVTAATPDGYTLAVHSQTPSPSEPGIFASVYMAFSKGDKLEHVIQKATELGAGEIIAFPSSRCVAKYTEKDLQKKLPRWQKIAASAAEQSGRGRIPAVLTLPSYKAALSRAVEADKAIFFYENEEEHTLSAALSQPFSTVALLSGPEGGFSREEADAAKDAGMELCTLGKRILRCETAPLCALSAVMYAAGEY